MSVNEIFLICGLLGSILLTQILLKIYEVRRLERNKHNSPEGECCKHPVVTKVPTPSRKIHSAEIRVEVRADKDGIPMGDTPFSGELILRFENNLIGHTAQLDQEFLRRASRQGGVRFSDIAEILVRELGTGADLQQTTKVYVTERRYVVVAVDGRTVSSPVGRVDFEYSAC